MKFGGGRQFGAAVQPDCGRETVHKIIVRPRDPRVKSRNCPTVHPASAGARPIGQALFKGAAFNTIDLQTVLDLPMPSAATVRALFDLTAAEARLARRLAYGDSLEEAAQRLSVKITTARTQLASIFAKTAIRRQAKLVAILARIAHIEQSAGALPAEIF
jgi:DNA-binding CsgD family transcriptional regulator